MKTLTTSPLKTRADYMAGKITHESYYSQFVTDAIKNAVRSRFSLKKLKTAYADCKHFNTIPLILWDNLPQIRPFESAKMQEIGETYSLGFFVCVAKHAAKEIVTSN